MAFNGFNEGSSSRAPLAEINMVPLIDVMLVLLVIFMVTAPLMSRAIKLDLPSASAKPAATAERVDLSLDRDGRLYWNREAIDEATLKARLQAQAQQAPNSELHIHADRAAPYEALARVLAAASAAGLVKIGFVTQTSPAE